MKDLSQFVRVRSEKSGHAKYRTRGVVIMRSIYFCTLATCDDRNLSIGVESGKRGGSGRGRAGRANSYGRMNYQCPQLSPSLSSLVSSAGCKQGRQAHQVRERGRRAPKWVLLCFPDRALLIRGYKFAFLSNVGFIQDEHKFCRQIWNPQLKG